MSDQAQNKNRRRRLDDFTDRFSKAASGPGPASQGTVSAVVQNLYELFTKDVTREGLRDLFQRDPKATYHFFMRGVDLTAFKALPWYKRYPVIVTRVFTVLAYQLSPPRRIAFAIACFSFFLGFIPRVQYAVRPAGRSLTITTAAGNIWWLIAVLIFAMLLLIELRDKLSLKADLEIAREIQNGLVASGLHTHGDFDIFCRMRPANTVGGDYCDLVELGSPEQVGIVIGDVAGKGMPAALLMALIQGSLRTLVTAGHRGTDLIAKLNSYLFASMPSNSFVTLFYSELNIRTGELYYINAGHNPPFLLRSSSFERLPPTAMVLGIMEGIEIEGARMVLAPTDHLLLYTDGVPEAADESGQEYGEDRLSDFLMKQRPTSQAELLDQLIARVIEHCGDNRPHDDMTMISVIRRRPQVDVMNPVLPPPIPTGYA